MALHGGLLKTLGISLRAKLHFPLNAFHNLQGTTLNFWRNALRA